jgi:hypothetical protein
MLPADEKLNSIEFEIPTDQALVISNILAKAWSAFGRPTEVRSEAGKKLMTVIIGAWEDSFPAECAEWQREQNNELLNERSVKESIKAGGHNVAAYPYWLYKMMTWGFPNERFAKRETVEFLVKNFPVFRTSNHT